MNYCCIIFGSYLNGYSIIQELHENGIRNIVLVDHEKKSAAYSNKILKFYQIEQSKNDVVSIINKLQNDYGYLILYPNTDEYLTLISEVSNLLGDSVFIPFNPDNVVSLQDKTKQYTECVKLGIPTPKTLVSDSFTESNVLNEFSYPFLLKPAFKKLTSIKIQRNLIVESKKDADKMNLYLENANKANIPVLISEIIPGENDSIYAYTGYRTRDGIIINEWCGRKLSQFPNKFGTFASASNESNEIVRDYGRLILNELNLWGINEPEFKFDYRDQKFKLMEVNLRPMMWHRVGALVGVSLNYIQYLDAIGEIDDYRIKTSCNKRIHYTYLQYEVLNFLLANNDLKNLNRIIKDCDELHIAFWDKSDLKPFFYSMLTIMNKILKR